MLVVNNIVLQKGRDVLNFHWIGLSVEPRIPVLLGYVVRHRGRVDS